MKKNDFWEDVVMGVLLTGLCLLVVSTSGCSTYGVGLTSSHLETNQMIADANTNRFKAFSEGMAACKENAACQVGLAMGFSANLGQQAFFKPETTSDLLRAFLPYATLGVDVARLWRMPNGGDGDSNGGFIITGDNNQLSGIGNKLTADNNSTLTGTFDSDASIEHLVYEQANTQSSSNGTGSVENVENQQDTFSGDTALPGTAPAEETPVE